MADAHKGISGNLKEEAAKKEKEWRQLQELQLVEAGYIEKNPPNLTALAFVSFASLLGLLSSLCMLIKWCTFGMWCVLKSTIDWEANVDILISTVFKFQIRYLFLYNEDCRILSETYP